jgi:hypothetical protein
MKKTSIISLILIITLTSCITSNSVVSKGLFQKRKYNKGYYVNRINKNKSIVKNEKSEPPSIKFSPISKTYLAQKDSIVVNKNESKTLIASTTNFIVDEENKLTQKIEKILEIKRDTTYFETPSEPKIEHLAEISAILGGLSLLLIFTGGPLIGIAAIVCGIISLKRQKKYPNLYDKKNKAKAWTGIVIGSLVLLAALFFIGYFLFVMTVI